MSRRAVFLDRDGTLVHPRHYPSRPDELVLYEGVGPELQALQQAGFRLVVITNQAGLARGLFSEQDLHVMHQHLETELQRFSVRLDGIYYCPHHVDGVIPALSIRCDCRKPEPGLVLRAARDLDLDLQGSWFVGDILDDVEAGNRARCRTILVDLGTETAPSAAIRRPTFAARSTVHALHIIAGLEGHDRVVDRQYLPERWMAPVARQETA